MHSPLASVFGLFGAGLLTFASPSILPIVPVYLSLLAGASVDALKKGERRGRLVASAIAFCAGLSVVFVALGLGATAAGRLLVEHRTLMLRVGGIAVMLFGLRAIGLLRLRFLDGDVRPALARVQTGGLLRAFVFGAAFAFGWSPCIGPVLASVLTYTASATSHPWVGGAYLGVYALGLSLPLIVVAAMAPLALRWLARARGAIPRLEKVTGVAMIAAGLFLLTGARLAWFDGFDGVDGDAGVVATTAPVATASGDPSAAPCDGAPSTGATTACKIAAVPVGTVAGELPRGPVMVEFVSPTCSVCRRMQPVITEAERHCRGEGARVLRVDTTTTEGAALAAKLHVVGTPTFVFLDREGGEIGRLIGEQPLAEIRQSLEMTFGQICAAANPGAPSSSG
jgi:cytochrome c-type biogenesis protein